MRQSQLFPSTRKEAPKEAESVNHKLLVRAGFIDQLMAGSWTLLPLGFRVIEKINNIIREEMNAIGGQELLMPLLHPKNIWNETGRWDKAGDIMYKLKDIRGKEYALSFTHEEIVMDLLRKNIKSYQDLPVCVYHFSTKFRNELRAKSGILRGREFMMKDLYSAHTTEEDLMNYYEKAKNAYARIFKRLGFNFRITEASGGVFTDKHTHEFQVLCAGGEDTIYICDKCDWGENKEIFDGKVGGVCPKCKKGKIVEEKSIEVGNIFQLGFHYSSKMKDATFIDKEGKQKPYYMGCYGIGISRVMGTIAEICNDDKGLIWPTNVAPFYAHLIDLTADKKGESVYKGLIDSGIEVLWDDRVLSAGEKFTDADLIGIPYRLVVSDKTETAGQIELKERTEKSLELIVKDQIVAEMKKRIVS